MTDQIKFFKTKTKPYKRQHCSYLFVSRKSKLNKRGIKRKRGEKLVLHTRSTHRSTYPELPNGQYYEYQVHIDPCMENKPCKEYYFHDIKQDHKHFLGVEIFQGVDPKYISLSSRGHFSVKAGVVTFGDKNK